MWPQNGPRGTAVGSGPWFRGVGEGEGGGVDDSIIADQRDRDLDWLSHPAPALPEGGNVRHHTQDALSTSNETGEWDMAYVFRPLAHSCAHTDTNTHLYMVSASTSPNHTRRLGVKFCPVSSNIATSPPPFNLTQTYKKGFMSLKKGPYRLSKKTLKKKLLKFLFFKGNQNGTRVCY